MVNGNERASPQDPPAKDHPVIMELHELKTKLFMEIVTYRKQGGLIDVIPKRHNPSNMAGMLAGMTLLAFWVGVL